jgi:hypothetical protein
VEERKFSKFKPTADMRLVPKYTSTNRIYKIRFFDFDKTQLFTLDGLYNQSVSTLIRDDGKYFYRYRSSDGLGKNQRYAFCGWKSEKD